MNPDAGISVFYPCFICGFPSPTLLRDGEMMLGSFQFEVEPILIVILLFILFGHRLPSVMRVLGRGVMEVTQAGPDRKLGIFACLALLVVLIGMLATLLFRV